MGLLGSLRCISPKTCPILSRTLKFTIVGSRIAIAAIAPEIWRSDLQLRSHQQPSHPCLRQCKSSSWESFAAAKMSQASQAANRTMPVAILSPFSTFQRFQYALFYIPIFKIFQVSVQHSPIYLTHFQNIFTLYISFFDFLCIPWTSMSNGVHEACCGGSPTCSRALIRLISAQPRKLYSEIVRIDPERAGRITGMMLEILGGFSNSINL